MATFIALFPVLWVFLSSIKPRQRDPELDDQAVHRARRWTTTGRCCIDTNFPTWFLNSVIVAAFTMVIGIAMSATAGYALSRFNFPGKRGS